MAVKNKIFALVLVFLTIGFIFLAVNILRPTLHISDSDYLELAYEQNQPPKRISEWAVPVVSKLNVSADENERIKANLLKIRHRKIVYGFLSFVPFFVLVSFVLAYLFRVGVKQIHIWVSLFPLYIWFATFIILFTQLNIWRYQQLYWNLSEILIDTMKVWGIVLLGTIFIIASDSCVRNWKTLSKFFRAWIFSSVIWILLVILIAKIFDPFSFMADEEYLKLSFIVAIPILLGAIKYLYNKLVEAR